MLTPRTWKTLIDHFLTYITSYVLLTVQTQLGKTALGKKLALIGWPWCLELPGVKAHNKKPIHLFNNLQKIYNKYAGKYYTNLS